jgi:hypothetical protein
VVVTPSWDPNAAPNHSEEGPRVPPSEWDPNAVPLPPIPPPVAGDQWVPVDPSSYSNPYTEAPVYTSGPQSIPTVPPPSSPLHAAIPAEFAPPAVPGPPPVPASPPGVTPHGFSTDGPGAPENTVADPMLSAGYMPEKGDLKIKERRTWKTWQLLIAVIVAAVVGMWFNGNAGSASGTGGGSGSGHGYKLPPAAGSSAAAGASGSSSTSAAGAATTTTAAGATTTTVAGGSSGSTTPTTAAAVGPATVLVPETQQTGNWTSPAFTIAGGTWNIGWAFQCVPAPSAPPAFQIFVVNNGAAPGASPAVTSSDASGNAIASVTSTGSQQIIVQTGASCRWAVKVTGSSS